MRKKRGFLRKAMAMVDRYHKAMGRLAIGLIACGLVALAVVWIVNMMSKEEESIVLEDTLSIIEDVRPRGEIYVCSSLIEDYAVRRVKEKNLLMTDKEHLCVQTMVQKCSYVIDLDKVEYEAVDSMKMVRVKMPKPEYVASTQGTSFMSDDSNFWATRMQSTNGMKQQVEAKIRRSFDTAENRRKAERYAEDAISEVLRQLGFEVEFVRTIETNRN